jgi:hypothetical protein
VSGKNLSYSPQVATVHFKNEVEMGEDVAGLVIPKLTERKFFSTEGDVFTLFFMWV